jgi:Amt family ammonium transporter
VLATAAVPNPAAVDGSLGLLWIQFRAVAITGGYAFVGTFVLLKLVNALSNVRVSDHEERVGLDLAKHREAAYTTID